MKPTESHKDPRVTNISFDNFTGSICIITPLSDNGDSNDDDDDNQEKDFMLSTSQTNVGADLFNPTKHVTLISQPLLAARSRKKNSNDSVINSRRSSFNETISLTSSNKFEKRTSHTESIDSGLDFSLSTNSSIQNSQQQQQTSTHLPIHRRLSALNEDSNVDEAFQNPMLTNAERRFSKENLNANNQTNLVTNEQEENTKKSTNTPPNQSLNDLTNLVPKPKKSSRKKTKLNIIVEPSVSLSSSTRFTIHDESIQSITRKNQQPMKPKAITPLGNYPNHEQIRAHINRSVIERQHPAYLTYLSRKDVLQHSNPFENPPVSLSKGNQNRSRKQKQFYENNQIQNVYVPTSRQSKKILVGYVNEDAFETKRKEKKILQENQQKELIHQKYDSRKPLKSNKKVDNRHEFVDGFLTSTPRFHHQSEYDQTVDTSFKKPNIYRRPMPPVLNQRFKPRTQNFAAIPLQSQMKHFSRPPNISNVFEEKYRLNRRPKSPTESINSSYHTNRNHPLIINNNQRLTKITSIPTQFDRVFPRRSQQYDPYETSSSSSSTTAAVGIIEEKFSHIHQSQPIDDQELLDGRYVIPSQHSQTNSPYQIYNPFTSISRLQITNNNPSSHELPLTSNHRSHSGSSASSLDRISPANQYFLPLEKVTSTIETGDLSTNYDSDDGWSNDSAELIYVDERYRTQKKKNINSSSSQQQQNRLLR